MPGLPATAHSAILDLFEREQRLRNRAARSALLGGTGRSFFSREASCPSRSAVLMAKEFRAQGVEQSIPPAMLGPLKARLRGLEGAMGARPREAQAEPRATGSGAPQAAEVAAGGIEARAAELGPDVHRAAPAEPGEAAEQGEGANVPVLGERRTSGENVQQSPKHKDESALFGGSRRKPSTNVDADEGALLQVSRRKGCTENASTATLSCEFCGGGGEPRDGCCRSRWCDGSKWSLRCCMHCDGTGAKGFSYKSRQGILDFSRGVSLTWLRAEALEELLRERGAPVRQQELVVKHPSLLQHREALYPDLKSSLLVVSHFWLSPSHPDPEGAHSKAISAWLGETTLQAGSLRSPHSLPRGNGYSGLFMDFCSLPQMMRNSEEELAFQAALSSMDLLFAHDYTSVLRVDTPAAPGTRGYEQRGWCRFEKLVAMMKLGSTLSISISNKEDLLCPRSPAIFDKELEDLHFTNRSTDKPLVSQLYKHLFDKKVQQLTVLRLNSISQQEVPNLAEVLPRMTLLEGIELEPLDDAAGEATAENIMHVLETGAADRLKWIACTGNAWGGARAQIKAAMKKRGIRCW